jgi:hypothetical protein
MCRVADRIGVGVYFNTLVQLEGQVCVGVWVPGLAAVRAGS